MKNSKIAWTDDTENIIRIKGTKAFYCTKVSPGCKNCYAEVMSQRIAAMCHDENIWKYKVYEYPPELELRRDIMKGWSQRKNSKKLFVSSMTDVFGEFVPEEWVYEILDAMIAAPKQTFQVLTKRAERMRVSVNQFCIDRKIIKLPENIWLVVSVEDQEWATKRLPELLQTNCSVRGLSCEPLLGNVNLGLAGTAPKLWGYGYVPVGSLLHWVIIGGESGRNARPMHPDWARNILNECKEADVAVFFKQWGNWLPWENDAQAPFLRSQNGKLADGHGMPSLDEMENSKRWDPGWWCVYEKKDMCIFENVGKDKSGDKIDDVQYFEFPKVYQP